jgi:predicted GIY-YIG superfamily endonuclease
MPQYNKSKIYKLQCEDGHFFIGSTYNELRFKFAQHKSASKTSTRRVYTHINQVGWNTVQIVLLEEVACENKQQLIQIEDRHIRRHHGNRFCFNVRCAVLTEEEQRRYNEAQEDTIQGLTQ